MTMPVRKKEQKCRRKEGKSQCRKPGVLPKTKENPYLLSVPTKPAPALPSPNPPPSILPTVVLPPNTVIPASHHEVAKSPTVPSKESKWNNRQKKGKEKENKTGARRAKTITQSSSAEGKNSSENDGKLGSKNDKKKKTYTESAETKSDGSKEPSDDDKTPQKQQLKKEMTKMFFKEMLASQRARKRTDDARQETMPESSQVNEYVKSYRSQMSKSPKSSAETELFNENGDPVWVYQETNEKKDKEGNLTANPELVKEMALANVTLDEKSFFDYLMEYISCSLPKGTQLPEDHEFDVYAPFEKLEENNEYVQNETVSFNTVMNAVESSEAAVKRFSKKHGGTEDTETQTITQETPAPTVSLPVKRSESQEELQLKSCVETFVTINTKNVSCVTYDRHNPIGSIQKLKKNKKRGTGEQITQNDP